MQKKILSSLILASALPFNVHALGLGDIEIYSALNQPLDAEISIVAAKPGEADSLLVKLASEQAFLKSGVERPFMLTKLKFKASYKADGTPIIKVTSRKAIREPFLNFLVDVEWPRGRLVREYTLLLDPPSFSTAKPVTSAAPAVAASKAVTGSAPIERAVVDTGVYGFAEPAPSTASAEPQEVATYQEPVKEVVQQVEEVLAYEEPLIEDIETIEVAADQIALNDQLIADAVAAEALEPQTAIEDELQNSSSPFSDLVNDIQGEESVEFDANELSPPAGEPSVDAFESPELSAATFGSDASGEELPDINLSLDYTKSFNAESILAGDNDYVDPEIEALLSADATPLYREPTPKAQPEVVYAAPEPVITEARPDTYTVEEGDIMVRIAEQFRPQEVDINQAMLAIMRYNPEAFIQENVNLVRKGQVLRIPDEEAMLALSNGDALAEVQGQNALWREYRSQLAGAQSQPVAVDESSAEDNANAYADNNASQSTQLALVAPGKDDESNNFAAGEQEGQGDTRRLERNLALAKEKLVASNLEQTELQSRINELEQIVTQSEGVIELKSQQLAQIQANAEQANAAADEVEAAVDETIAAVDEDLLAGIDGVEDVAVVAESADPVVEAAVADIAVTEAVETISARPDGLGGVIYDLVPPSLRPSLQPILSGPLLFVILALPIILILIAVFVLARKGKKEPEIVFTEDNLAASEEPALDDVEDDVDATLSMNAAEDDMEATMVSTVAETVLAAPEVEGEAPTNDDIQDDTTAEVDVYIAYGLHDQAEELLKQSISDNPDITAYRGKLLETYFNAGKKDEFITEAQALSDHLAGQSSNVWDKAIVMGKEIAPDNMLFSGAEVSGDIKASDFAAAKPDMADLDIGSDEGGMDIDLGGDDIDLSAADLDGDQAASVEEDEFSLDDVAAELDASLDDEAPEAPAEEGELEFDVADFIDEDEEEVTAEDKPDEMDIDVADFMDEPEAADLDVEMDLGDDLDLSEASEDADIDMDFALDEDVSLDLGSEEVSLDVDEALADEGFDLSEDLDVGADLDMSDDLSMDLDADSLAEPVAEESSADDSLDFDMDGFDLSADEESSNDTLGLDDDAFDDAADSTQMIDDESLETMIDDMDSDEADFGLDDDMPDNLDEVGTKLDLAKAYIDMGDADGAKASLEEVIQEGSAQQKKEAEELLAQI